MITPDQLQQAVEADSVGNAPQYTPLTAREQILIENLVKNYKPYREAVGRWPNLSALIDEEQANPTDKTYFLKAVLAALNDLPSIHAESQGSDESQGFFSVYDNWGLLAQDVLNCLYQLPVVIGKGSYIVVQRKIEDLLLSESSLTRNETIGRLKF